MPAKRKPNFKRKGWVARSTRNVRVKGYTRKVPKHYKKK